MCHEFVSYCLSVLRAAAFQCFLLLIYRSVMATSDRKKCLLLTTKAQVDVIHASANLQTVTVYRAMYRRTCLFTL